MRCFQNPSATETLFLALLFHMELVSNWQQTVSNSSLGIQSLALGKPLSLSLPVVPQLRHLRKGLHLHTAAAEPDATVC